MNFTLKIIHSQEFLAVIPEKLLAMKSIRMLSMRRYLVLNLAMVYVIKRYELI